MVKQLRSAFILLSLISLLCFLGCKKQEATETVTIPKVAVLRLAEQDLSLPIEFVGQTKGAIDADIRARVEGTLLGVHFQEGKEVNEGDLLYTIDPAPFEAKLAQAQGKVAEAETKLVKADADLKRVKPLAEMKALSQRDLESSIAMQGVAKGGLDAARASLEAAQIELSYTKIKAPISGLIGLTKARVGELVGRAPNTSVLTTISQLDPIHVRFSISEKDYLYFAKLKQEQTPGQDKSASFTLTLILSDGSEHPEKGRVSSVDAQVDATTGTLAVEAAFPNPNKIVRPGQFAKIRTISETRKNIIAIPKKAIRDLQGVKQIAVVSNDGIIEIRPITIGREVGELVEVTDGLSAQDVIVPEFQQRLKSGMKIEPTFS